jgi:hypothetical protein
MHSAKHDKHKIEVYHFDVNFTQFGPITENTLFMKKNTLFTL